MEKISSVPITSAEALAILKNRKKEGEIGYEQEATMDLLKKTVKLTKKDAEKMKRELEELGFLKPEEIVKIVDTLPATEMEFKAVFEKKKIKAKGDDLKKILEIVQKFA